MNGDDEARTAELLAELEGLGHRACAGCGARVGAHDYVLSVVGGFKDRQRCLACLAEALGRPAPAIAEHLQGYVDRHACFRAAWQWATDREGAFEPGAAAPGAGRPETTSPRNDTPREGRAWAADDRWDAGDMGCGDLVLELRLRLHALAPGAILHLLASDPGASADIPAWCGLTGHELIESRHPEYWIRRKKEV